MSMSPVSSKNPSVLLLPEINRPLIKDASVTLVNNFCYDLSKRDRREIVAGLVYLQCFP